MNKSSAKVNTWELAVLAFLREGPMHPYEIQRLLKERHKDELLDLKRGSLYHAIHRLLKQGLIQAVGTERDGLRPEKTTYRATAAGRAALLRWVRAVLSLPPQGPSEFMVAMSFLVHLTPQEAVPQLEARMAWLRVDIADTEKGMASAVARAKRINLIESEYLCAMRKAELAWIEGLLGELRSGEFHWDFKTILREAKAEHGPPTKAKPVRNPLKGR